jgi:5-hydroxyisourate hydrolase-like protein (transthyretin family)
MDDITFKVDNQATDSNNMKMSTEDSAIENNILETGQIIVTSVLEFEKNEYLQGVKINLYKINGLSPVLIKSKMTNEEGNVIFSELEEGCYRIIEIIDKRYFEKPKYINWNEIMIDNINKNQKVVVVNKIKKFIAQDKYKHCI